MGNNSINILHANIIVKYNGQLLKINDVVIKEGNTILSRHHILNKYKITNPVPIIKIETIKVIGVTNDSNEYKEIKKSNEERNKITGQYD